MSGLGWRVEPLGVQEQEENEQVGVLEFRVEHFKASEFVRFAKVFPLKELGFVPEPGGYLAAVGWVEVTAGLLLALGPQLLQEISNFVLSVVMIGAIYTLLALREPLAMCAPATLCLGLLLLLNIRGYPAAPRPKFE
ncbi:transmembrane protein 35B [Pitangus sulphuratus]|nr:transmembrane protein 35B [Pitangus sulphuratus]